MRAILLGATGLTGSLLLQKLLIDPVFSQVKVITRKPTGIVHDKLLEVIIDLQNEEAYKAAITPADVLFCCIGTTQSKVKGDKDAYRAIDFDIPVKAAKYAAAQHIGKYIIVSAVGADSRSANFYLKLKGETEQAILQQSISAVYILRPSILMGQRKERRVMEKIAQAVMRVFSLLLIGSLQKYRAIDADTVAQSMINAAKRTETGKFIWEYREMKNA